MTNIVKYRTTILKEQFKNGLKRLSELGIDTKQYTYPYWLNGPTCGIQVPTNQTFIIQNITLLQQNVFMRYAKGKKMAT